MELSVNEVMICYWVLINIKLQTEQQTTEFQDTKRQWNDNPCALIVPIFHFSSF